MFIVFEGIDGSGKSTAIQALKEALESEGEKVIVTAEPTGGAVGKIVAETDGLGPETEALLFTADRSIHTAQIEDWVSQGFTVLCDRYFGSTLAYQSAAGMDIEWLKALNLKIIKRPDITFLLDIDPEVSLDRVGRRGERSRFEKLEYLKEVRKRYLEIASEYGFAKVDADRDRGAVAEELIEITKKIKTEGRH